MSPGFSKLAFLPCLSLSTVQTAVRKIAHTAYRNATNIKKNNTRQGFKPSWSFSKEKKIFTTQFQTHTNSYSTNSYSTYKLTFIQLTVIQTLTVRFGYQLLKNVFFTFSQKLIRFSGYVESAVEVLLTGLKFLATNKHFLAVAFCLITV